MLAGQLTLWMDGILFAVFSVVIWIAGKKATRLARRLADRFDLGEAFVGMLLLGIVTSLPEVATTSSAAGIGSATLAGSNLLGGVALQMALLAAIDGIALRPKPLSAVAADRGLVMQAIVLTGLALLTAFGIATTALPSLRGVGAGPVLLAGTYLLAVYALYRREKARPEAGPDEPSGQRRKPDDVDNAEASTIRLGLAFMVSALAIFCGGFVVAESASAIADQLGISATIVGASLVALATSLPEITTTFAAVRLGSYGMAIGNILGTNALELALFLPADLMYGSGPIFAALGRSELALALLNVALGTVLIWGLTRKSARTIVGFGADSLVALGVYGAGLSLAFIAA